MEGIKETQEALVAALKIAKVVAVALKDGAQLGDLEAVYNGIMNDPVVKQAVIDGYQDISKVPAELQDIDTTEVFQLLMAALPELSNLIGALKATKAA